MAKIELDKYYTPSNIVDGCVDKVLKLIGNDVKHIIEPSAGDGVFINKLNSSFTCNIDYYDIAPEHNDIIKQDYLELDIDYVKGRLIIGNPPFGNRSTLIVKFFKKSARIADYIAFILPISQLNNTKQLYEFDLICSQDLGIQKYSGVELHCCFNIYKRPTSGVLNSKPKMIKIDGLEVIEYRRGYHKPCRVKHGYFYSVCSWGRLGHENTNIGDYAKEMYFYSDDEKLKYIIKSINWLGEVNNISTPYMPKGKVLEVIQIKLKDYSCNHQQKNV